MGVPTDNQRRIAGVVDPGPQRRIWVGVAKLGAVLAAVVGAAAFLAGRSEGPGPVGEGAAGAVESRGPDVWVSEAPGLTRRRGAGLPVVVERDLGSERASDVVALPNGDLIVSVVSGLQPLDGQTLQGRTPPLRQFAENAWQLAATSNSRVVAVETLGRQMRLVDPQAGRVIWGVTVCGRGGQARGHAVAGELVWVVCDERSRPGRSPVNPGGRGSAAAYALDDGRLTIGPVRIGRIPMSVAPAVEGIWVANFGDRTLTRLTAVGTGDPVGRTVTLPGAPSRLTVSDGALWVAYASPAAVERRSLETGAPFGSLTAVAGDIAEMAPFGAGVVVSLAHLGGVQVIGGSGDA